MGLPGERDVFVPQRSAARQGRHQSSARGPQQDPKRRQGHPIRPPDQGKAVHATRQQLQGRRLLQELAGGTNPLENRIT
eukprot:1394371-Amorphochlora_amoeboformis.AAC.1